MEERRVGLRMVRAPVVEAAAAVDEESTAELPRAAFLDAVAGDAAFHDRLVPGPGLRAWAIRAGTILRECRLPLLLVAVVSAGLMQLLVGRVGDTIVAAPVLVDLADGVGLLILPLIWACWLATAALPIVLCLTAVVGIVTAWGGSGRLPGPRRVWRLVGHRLGPLWAWLAAVGAVAQALPLLFAAEATGPRLAIGLSVLLAVGSSGLATLMGVLGCVVIFERGRGPRRAQQLLSSASGKGVTALALAAAAMTVLPSVAARAGALAAAVVTAVTVLLWAVAALVTYAQARRSQGPVSSVSLGREAAL
jgi:hypothetical protein